MTPKDLQALRQATKRDILIDIRITKAIYEGIGGTDRSLYPYSEHLEVRDTIAVRVETDEPIPEPVEPTVKHKMIGLERRYTGYTTPVGRSDLFSHITLFYSYLVPKTYTDEELDILINLRTKRALTDLVRPKGVNRYTFSLDCQLLKLFKEDRMTMDEVVERALEGCTL